MQLGNVWRQATPRRSSRAVGVRRPGIVNFFVRSTETRRRRIGEESSWHLAHRLRLALASDGWLFSGPVEVDETYMGGRAPTRMFGKKLFHVRRRRWADFC